MTESPCENYSPWMDHGLQINECLEYHQGLCHEPMSPHDGCDCPWSGYPCPADDGAGRWKGPDPTPEQMLARNCLSHDVEAED